MQIFLIRATQLILSLSILILVHEFGHVLFSFIFKVKVEKFYLFFNPWFSLFKYKSKKTGTEYGIGWLPFGGYAKIAGMVDESLEEEFLEQTPQLDWEYCSKPIWNRLLISIGGVLMNFILSFFIYLIIVFQWGDSFIPINKVPLFFCELAHQAGFHDRDILFKADGKILARYDDLDLFRVIDARQIVVLRDGEKKQLILPNYFGSRFIESKMVFADCRLSVIDSILSGSNAEKSGLKNGDRILLVNGNSTSLFEELVSQLSKNKNKEVLLKVERDATNLNFKIQVDSKGMIGIISTFRWPLVHVHPHSIEGWLATGLRLGVRKFSFYILQLKFLFTKTGIENVGGFGSIGRLFPVMWDWFTFWHMTAFLSIVLGVMNILPIPSLDGGHVIFLLYEAIVGRKPNKKLMKYAQIIGMTFLFITLVYANVMDLIRTFF